MNEIGKHVIKRVRKGNIKAFQKLVEHYQQSVYNICVLMMGNEKEAEELARETFVYAYSHIEDYFKSGKKFSIWLYQAIVSLAQQSLKEDFEVCDAQSAKGILPLLLNIPLNKRLAIILDCWYYLSDKEISDVLHTTNSEVHEFIYQAREKLSKVLAEKGNVFFRSG